MKLSDLFLFVFQISIYNIHLIAIRCLSLSGLPFLGGVNASGTHVSNVFYTSLIFFRAFVSVFCQFYNLISTTMFIVLWNHIRQKIKIVVIPTSDKFRRVWWWAELDLFFIFLKLLSPSCYPRITMSHWHYNHLLFFFKAIFF